MNERIRELAEQVGFHSSAIIDLGTGTGVEVWHKYDIENDQEHFPTDEMMTKFAELIVQECARIGELKEQGYEDYDPDLSVGWYMKQHFGVKS